ncbi:hypothetical protein LSAT2_029009 [Lamellibrachia satsuma]|nr:hypothetical protein LSAT2_029009 [Lamellibrachia satsuma]
MCLGVFFFRASTSIPVNADSTAPKLKELEKKLSELEDGVEQYKEQKTSSLQTAVRSTEVVADLMTAEDKELIDRLVARMKFLQAQRAAEKSRQTEGVSDQDKSPQQQDIRQDKSEGQFQDPAGQQETREVDLNWADQAVDDAQLGVDAETSKCTDSNCLGEKAEGELTSVDTVCSPVFETV